jgi:hypothetical protein
MNKCLRTKEQITIHKRTTKNITRNKNNTPGNKKTYTEENNILDRGERWSGPRGTTT